MAREVKIGNKWIGDGHPTYIVAEIGINHNGDIGIAKELIQVGKRANVDAVKFQKRTPELCVPLDQRHQMRETPWGYISYLDYRYKVEFNEEEYDDIDRFAREIGIDWFVSVWDEPSVDFMERIRSHRIQSPFSIAHRQWTSKAPQIDRQTPYPLHRDVHPRPDQVSGQPDR